MNIKLDGTKSEDRDYLSKKKWREENREKDRISKQKWIKNNPEKRKQVIKKYDKKNKEKHKEQSKKYREKYPEKHIAKNAARYINKNKRCKECGSNKNLEKHHKDYSKPKKITTLCRRCHKKIHSKNGNWSTNTTS